MDAARLEALDHIQLDPTYKALPLAPGERIAARDVGTMGWNILAGDLDLPAMVIKERPMAANLELMADFCRSRNLEHAPHGKTTMAPQLFARQLTAGAWGMTAANIAQCRVYREFGVDRILLANELVDPRGLRWIAAELAADPAFEFLCYVDSARGVELAESALAESGSQRQLDVLVEYGYPGGRSGCRSIEGALALAALVNAAPHLRLHGVAGYEGLMPGPDVTAVLARSAQYLGEIKELVVALDRAGLLPADEEIVVSAGGSSYFDVVADVLGPDSFDRPVRTVVRSGCYITHDVSMFESTSPFGARAPESGPHLEPALELWARVWSRPEPGLAIVGFGKRDAPYDNGLPIPAVVRAQGGTDARDVAGTFMITGVNDQHAFMTIPEDDDLEVGDVVVLGISHPCTAFDKWRYLPLVDDGYTVVGGVFTFF